MAAINFCIHLEKNSDAIEKSIDDLIGFIARETPFKL